MSNDINLIRVAKALRYFFLGSLVWALPGLIPNFVYEYDVVENWPSVITSFFTIVLFGFSTYEISEAIDG